MKKNIFKKVSLALALTLAVVQIFTVCALAAPEESEWEMSEDRETLYYGGEVYEIYEPDVTLYSMASTVYCYVLDEYYSYIHANMDDVTQDIVWTDTETYYVTKGGREEIEDFLDGSIGSFLISESDYVYYNADLDNAVVSSIDADYFEGVNLKKVDVRDLKDLQCFNLLAVDKSGTLAYVYGALYALEYGGFYYLNYSNLGNQYFDADGNFSYRSGEVYVCTLGAGVEREIEEAKDEIEDNYPEYIWEDDFHMGVVFDPAAAIVLFWICFILVGFILPIPFLVIGLVFPRSKKKGEPKYWYILSMIAGLWLLLATVLLIVILLV